MRKAALAALMSVLAGCSHAPSELERWQAVSAELARTPLRYDYAYADGRSAPNTAPADVRAATDAKIERSCLEGPKESFDVFRRSFLLAPDIARASQAAEFGRFSDIFDQQFPQCLARLGFQGQAFWEWDGRRLNTVEFSRVIINHASAKPAAPARFFLIGGCGSRGGPGYRRPDGQCASWQD
ncbi:hypothetical protein [Roseateles depolymerans]|uniref:hypothetical protein n=1 Tax=Roseateles depolymerans TaxID=76731 RepID=UPI0011C056D3|nr:hypothetical protein [Roseateles depolymerans]